MGTPTVADPSPVHQESMRYSLRGRHRKLRPEPGISAASPVDHNRKGKWNETTDSGWTGLLPVVDCVVSNDGRCRDRADHSGELRDRPGVHEAVRRQRLDGNRHASPLRSAPSPLADYCGEVLKAAHRTAGRNQRRSGFRALAKKLANVPIDVLINNAGVYNDRSSCTAEDEGCPGDWTTQTFGKMRFDLLRHHHGGERERSTHRLRSLPWQCEGRARRRSSLPSARATGTSPGRTHVRPGTIFYRTSKAALNRSMQIVAASVKTDGVTVVMLNPGPTLTEHQAYLKEVQRNVEDRVHRGTHDQDDRQSDHSGHRQISALRRDGRAMVRTVVVLAAAIGVTIMSAGCKHNARSVALARGGRGGHHRIQQALPAGPSTTVTSPR